MSWSADWHLPHPRIDLARLRDVLPTATLTAVDGGERCTTARIALPGGSGCFELWSNEPTETSEQAWTRDQLDGLHDDAPYPYLGLADGSLGGVTITGQGRGVIELDRRRGAASVRTIVRDDDFGAWHAGISGIAHAHGTWHFGGPHLLYRDGVRMRTGLETRDLDAVEQFVAIAPVSETRVLALTDTGLAYWIEHGRATPVSEVAPAEQARGYWDAPWTIASWKTGHMIANGSAYWLDERGVTRIDVDGIEQVVVAGNGVAWARTDRSILVGDGFAWQGYHAGECSTIAAGRAGIVAFAPGRMLLCNERDEPREIPLAVTEHVRRAACTEGDLVWALTSELVIAIEPGGPPHTRMSLRSNRDDNAALWSAMYDLGTTVATALGGWAVP